ncbi:MAG: prepilin-type N-terminal cleavage/methylation domain-containing protein [Planctomycetes bacterium]|nr:prepilin-type N-terminal cleavage/methylation domain-containing protein [Planctomycetota bacterium]
MTRRRAFTLIELLVVISIIAVLSALLLPAIKVVRDQARGISCSGNQRQVMMAVIGYADEQGGILPFSRCEVGVPAEYGLPTGDTIATWLNTASVGQYLGVELDRSWIGYAKARKVLKCAEDRESTQIDSGTTSYGLNQQFCPDVRTVPWPVGINYPGWAGMAALSTIRRKSACVIVIDAGGDVRWSPGNGNPRPCTPNLSVGQPALWAPATRSPTLQVPRHRRGTNVAFLDGHTGWFADLGQESLAGRIFADPRYIP